MSTISDDELQKQVEEGREHSGDDREFAAYQKVFSILSEKPAYESIHIEDAVISKIEKAKRRSTVREYLWLAAGVMFLLIGGVIAVTMSDIRIYFSGWQRNIMMLGLFAGLVIVVLNAIERKLLNRITGRH